MSSPSAEQRQEPLKLLVFVPSRRAPSETFIRANLRALPYATSVYCGDERPWGGPPLRLAFGLAILFSKVLDRAGWQRLANWLPSRIAIAICRRERPDVVLAEFGFHAVRVMDLVPATGLPLIVHFRGADASSRLYLERLGPQYRRLLRLCSAVVVKSQPMANTLRSLALERATPLPLLISPSGADPDHFGGSDPAAAAPLFLAVGRFVAKKGPLLTLEAFARAARGRSADLRLVMVGAGPLLAEARQRAVALGVERQVLFTGLQTPEQVAGWMRRSCCFLQHSLTGPDGDQEGSPVAVMEAQLSGLPVVATRHAGIPEVVLEGTTGLLVEEGDWEGMARAIGLIADDPSLAARLGRAGRDRCAARFTVAHHIEQLMALIERVRSAPSPPDTRPAP
jgi:glycosyltransferase involved in cell wall biosynthesis